MKLSKKHWYHAFLSATKGTFQQNPVLSLALALPFAVVVSTNLQSGVAMIWAFLFTYVPVTVLAGAFGQKIPSWIRLPIYPMAALILLIPARLLAAKISVTLLDTVGVYFSLCCVSTLLLMDAEQAVLEHNPKKTALQAFGKWVGCAIVLLVISSVREILGNGTIWGTPLPQMTIRFRGVMVAGAGWILLGFVAAFGKKLHRTILSMDHFLQTQKEKKEQELLNSKKIKKTAHSAIATKENKQTLSPDRQPETMDETEQLLRQIEQDNQEAEKQSEPKKDKEENTTKQQKTSKKKRGGKSSGKGQKKK